MEVPSTAATESTKSSGTYPLKEEEEIALYEAKCEDLGRKSTDVQKERFLHTLRSRCPSRIFDLAESGIGPVAMMVLEEVLLKYPQYSVLKLGLLPPRPTRLDIYSLLAFYSIPSIKHSWR